MHSKGDSRLLEVVRRVPTQDPLPVLQLSRQVPSLRPELLDQALPDHLGSRALVKALISASTWKPSRAKETTTPADYFYLLCADKVKDWIMWLMGKQTTQQTARGCDLDWRSKRTTKGWLSDKPQKTCLEMERKQHRTLFRVKQYQSWPFQPSAHLQRATAQTGSSHLVPLILG